MSYVKNLQDGTPVQTIHQDLVSRLYRRHAEDGPGRLCLGMLPRGASLLYEQGFFGEDSALSVMRGGKIIAFTRIETDDLIAALALLDRKIERYGLA